jgi:uncharacterized membrane protein YesL
MRRDDLSWLGLVWVVCFLLGLLIGGLALAVWAGAGPQ